MIDLEEIQRRLDQGVASLTDTHDLLREVERLRELLLNAGWPREDESIAKVAQQAERAAVVAWLRSDEPDRIWADSIGGSEYTCAAASIERGEHRREETK